MTITHNIPANTRKPGVYVNFNLLAAGRGLRQFTNRMVAVGLKLAAGTATALEPVQVFSDADADRLFGAGSELALMCRWAMKAARDHGVSAELWAVPIADPAGTADVDKFTIAAGIAAEAGDIVVKIAGRVIRAGVDAGDDQDAAATALEAAINALGAELPVTAAVNGVNPNEVDATARQTGVNGADIAYEVVSYPDGLTTSVATSVAGAGAYDVTAALDVLGDKDYDMVALANHTSTDIDDCDAHLDEMFAAGQKRWRHTIMAETGVLSAGTTLATAANDYRQMVVSAEGFPNTPGEIAAYLAMTIAARTDPALPFNHLELGSLYLPAASKVPLDSEIETALAAGATVLSVNEQQTRATCVRAVTTKTTESSAPYYELLDITISRSLFYFARQVVAALQVAFSQAKQNQRTRDAIRGVILDVAYRVEELEIIQNVDAHKDEFVVDTDSVDVTAVAAAIPTSVVPPLAKVIPVFNLLIE